MALEPALGKASFDVTFMNAAPPGAPLPDLLQLVSDPQPEQAPWSIQVPVEGLQTKPTGPRRNCVFDELQREWPGACTKEIVEILDEKCSGHDD